MDYSIDELSSWDIFFYYGKNNLDLELSSDLMLLMYQRDRSLYYDRRESGGVSGYENHPNDLGLQVNIRYNAANAIAWKNSVVADGLNGLPDRRIAVSQTSISFLKSGGELDVIVLFIPYYNFNNYRTINVPMAGVK